MDLRAEAGCAFLLQYILILKVVRIIDKGSQMNSVMMAFEESD
jgi:hypothetical protein